MSFNWKLFRIICFLQLLLTAFYAVTSFISLFQYSNSFYYFFQAVAFGLMFWLAVIGLSLLNNNYPDKPVTGTEKTIFNWLFILNFILLAFLFGLFFAEISRLNDIRKLFNNRVLRLSFAFFLPVLLSFITLLFQLLILYGLYNLRRLLYFNFTGKEFEFEKKTSP